MRHLTLVTLLSTAGLVACNKNPLAPTQATTAATAAAPAATMATPANLPAVPVSSASDCEQSGENIGECGTQAGDATETPDNGSTETPGSESPKLP
jgi:hypothetical protein